MIQRHFDAVLHNAIANHPEVKPTFGYNEGLTDLAPLLEHPEAYILLSDGKAACSVFEWSAPGVWQGHSFFLPEARGKHGIQTGKEMCRYMFDLGARMLWGMTPLQNRAAMMFNRLLGFKEAGEGVEASGHRVRFFILEK